VAAKGGSGAAAKASAAKTVAVKTVELEKSVGNEQPWQNCGINTTEIATRLTRLLERRTAITISIFIDQGLASNEFGA